MIDNYHPSVLEERRKMSWKSRLHKAIAQYCKIAALRQFDSSHGGGFYHDYPNFTEDLDWCREMEKCIPDELKGNYAETLQELTASKENDFALIHTSAEQRCEAFLLTVGIWSDFLGE